MLQIENLSVSYGSVRALSDVDLEVRGDGILHGVIGPNGAGKSTLLDAVCGRRRPVAGSVFLPNIAALVPYILLMVVLLVAPRGIGRGRVLN